MKTRHGKVFSPDASTTHQEFLKECIMKTTGDILEFGCSQGSTGFILDLIQDQDRKLTTLSNEPKESLIFTRMYPDDEKHKWIITHKNWDALIQYAKSNMYSVIFVDSYPWSSRGLALEEMYDKCEYMVIHDAKILMEGKFIQPTDYFEELELCFPLHLDAINAEESYYSTLICSKPKII